MKQLLIFISLSLLLCNCRKEQDDGKDQHLVPVRTAYIQGTVYNALNGLPVANAYVSSEPAFTALTDSTGHYCLFRRWGGYNYWNPVITDSLEITVSHNQYGTSGLFPSTELVVNDTITKNIYTSPVGFLKLHVKDVGFSNGSISMDCSNTASDYYLYFQRPEGPFFDTTFTLEIIPDKTVQISWNYWNSYASPAHSVFDSSSVFVPGNDTVAVDVLY